MQPGYIHSTPDETKTLVQAMRYPLDPFTFVQTGQENAHPAMHTPVLLTMPLTELSMNLDNGIGHVSYWDRRV